MELAGRKQIVLAAVVEHYLRTGEPVGSKAVLEQKTLNVSSATIRNDMAALEREGYLEQPHTSAGRIPTVQGCRYYIDHLMQPYVLTETERTEIDRRLEQGGANAETVVQNAAEALSEITQLAVVNASNLPEFTVISQVEVIPAGKRLYALLMITSTGDIKNRMCLCSVDLTQEQLIFFENFLRENLVGQSPRDLNPAQRQKLAVAMGSYMLSFKPPAFMRCTSSASSLTGRTSTSAGKASCCSAPGLTAAVWCGFWKKRTSWPACWAGLLAGCR